MQVAPNRDQLLGQLLSLRKKGRHTFSFTAHQPTLGDHIGGDIIRAMLEGIDGEQAPPLARPLLKRQMRSRACERAPPLALPAGWACCPPEPLHLMSVV